MSSIVAPDAVVAERDLPVQAAKIGEIDRMSLPALPVRVGVELADVVQQRPCHRHVAVDAGERRRDRAHRLGDAEAVLEQSVAVGLVVVLGGGRSLGSAPTGASPRRRPAPAAAVKWGLRTVAISSRRSRSICSGERAGPSSSWAMSKLPGSAGASERRFICGPKRGCTVKRPFTYTAVPRPAKRLHLGQVLPDHRDHGAGAVAELQAQVVAAVAARAPLNRAHQQHLVDSTPSVSSLTSTYLKVEPSADGIRPNPGHTCT